MPTVPFRPRDPAPARTPGLRPARRPPPARLTAGLRQAPLRAASPGRGCSRSLARSSSAPWSSCGPRRLLRIPSSSPGLDHPPVAARRRGDGGRATGRRPGRPPRWPLVVDVVGRSAGRGPAGAAGRPDRRRDRRRRAGSPKRADRARINLARPWPTASGVFVPRRVGQPVPPWRWSPRGRGTRGQGGTGATGPAGGR